MLQRFQIKFFLVKKKSILESKKDSDYNLLDATKLTFWATCCHRNCEAPEDLNSENLAWGRFADCSNSDTSIWSASPAGKLSVLIGRFERSRDASCSAVNFLS